MNIKINEYIKLILIKIIINIFLIAINYFFFLDGNLIFALFKLLFVFFLLPVFSFSLFSFNSLSLFSFSFLSFSLFSFSYFSFFSFSILSFSLFSSSIFLSCSLIKSSPIKFLRVTSNLQTGHFGFLVIQLSKHFV